MRDHLQRQRQMALVSGPRQVGMTTACRSVADAYLNWDNAEFEHGRTVFRADPLPGWLAGLLE